MQKIVVFQKFPNIEEASDLILLLKNNNIPFEIDDRGQRFSLVSNPMDDLIKIKINETDIEKANLLLKKSEIEKFKNHNVDHYLYTFSDADIVDIIANPDEWNNLEVEIANKIIKDRKIELSAEIILKAKRNKKETEVKEILKTKNNIKSQASWFMIIAVLSVINSIGLILEWKFYLLFGLGITQVFDGLIYGLTGQFTIYNLLTSALVSSVFVLFWYYAKQEKRWAFLAGIIVYGIDSLIFVYAKDWLSFGFHIFGLIGMVSAYVKLLENKKANNN